MKKCILIVMALLLVLAAGCGREDGDETPPSQPVMTSFEECAAAGYPVMESYPRQCRADGQTFVEKVDGSIIDEPPMPLPDSGFCGSSTGGPCETGDDCTAGGCSGQVCQSKDEEPVITTCEYRDCYDEKMYSLECGCVQSRCEWTDLEGTEAPGDCSCPEGYIKEGVSCTPECYYSTPPCLQPSIQCQ